MTNETLISHKAVQHLKADSAIQLFGTQSTYYLQTVVRKFGACLPVAYLFGALTAWPAFTQSYLIVHCSR